MGKNILITGAAGYIGGSILSELISRTSGPIETAKIHAAVRSDEQIRLLSKLGINIIQVDLNDEKAVSEAVLNNEIDIAIHTAGSFIPKLLSNVIIGLGQRRKVSGEQTYFVQASVSAVYSAEGGWPYGEIKDSDDSLFEKEKGIAGDHEVRQTNVLMVELAKAQGVTCFNLPIPLVYGRGSGEGRKISVSLPAYIRTSIKEKIVHKFDMDANSPAVHISDLTAFYALLVEKILQGEPIPNGEKGYYFPFLQTIPMWETLDRIAASLHSQGLVSSPKAEIWPSHEVAAQTLGFPLKHLVAMCATSGELVPVNAFRLGWEPKWTTERFLESIDDEIRDVQELDTVKFSLFDSLVASKN